MADHNHRGNDDMQWIQWDGQDQLHYVCFHKCWNESQQKDNTQVFIFQDRPKDANAVVIAWTGTDPFNVDNWLTDFEFSLVQLQQEPEMNVHHGFLKGLGLYDQILDEVSERNYFNRRMYRNHRTDFSELRRPAEYSKKPERFFDIGSKTRWINLSRKFCSLYEKLCDCSPGDP